MEMEFLVTVVVNEELRSRGQVEHYIPLGTRMAACNRKKKKSGSPQGSLSFFPLTNLEIIIAWLPWISGARGSYVFCFRAKAFYPEASWFEMSVGAPMSSQKKKQKIGSRVLYLHLLLRINASNCSHGFFLYYSGYNLALCACLADCRKLCVADPHHERQTKRAFFILNG